MNRILQVVLTGNNTSLKGVLAQSAAEVKAYGNTVQATNRQAAASNGLVSDSMKAVAAGGLAVAAALAFSVAKAAQFQAAMLNVNSLAGLSEGGLKSLSSQVLELSTVLPQSAEVLAEGLYDVVGSGFQAADALTVLRASAVAASAGLTTTEVAGRAISGVLNAYGLEAKDAGDVSDVLFQTVNLGVLSFDELAGSIGDTIGTAAAAKVSIAEVGSAIATMTLTGISGAEASTSLNNVLQSMIQPSEELAAMYHQLGYSSGAQALEADGLRGVMEKLRVATHGNITELLGLFPNIRAARGALALMSDEGRNYARVSKDLEDKNARQGATAKVLAEQLKGAGAQLTLLKNGAEAAAISIGTKVLPYLTSFMGALQQVGGFIGDVAADVGQRLEPAWQLLVRTGTALWEVLSNIYDVGAPIAGILVAIGGGAAIGALTALLTVVAEVSEFLADNKEIATALAIVLAVQLAGGLTAVQVAAWRFVATPVVLFLSGILTGASALAAFLRGGLTGAFATARGAALTLASAAAPLAVLTVLVAAVQGVIDFSHAGEDATKNIRALSNAIKAADTNSGRFATINAGLLDLKNKAADAQAVLDSYNNQGWFNKNVWFGPGEGAAVTDAKKSVEAYGDAIKDLQEQELHASASTAILASQFHITGDEVQALADKYGIDLTGSVSESIRLFENYNSMEMSDAKVAKTGQLIDALGVLADEASTAEDRIDALKTALDALGGKQVSVFEATTALNQAVDKSIDAVEGMTGAVLDANGGLNAYTEAGQAAGEVLLDVRDKGNDLISTLIGQGESLETVQKADADLRASFILSANNMGITGQAAEDLADSVLGVPSDRETRFRAAMGSAPQQIAELKRQIDALEDKVVNIVVNNRTVYYNDKTKAHNETGLQAGFTGGIRGYAYATGGTHGLGMTDVMTGGSLPASAGIARDGANLVQWAEPGTGGEAFVPLGNRYATKSQELVRWLYDYFFPPTRAFASGGFSGSPGGYTASVPSSAYAPAAPNVTALVEAAVRVFVGDREITDIVDVQVDSRIAKSTRSARAAGAGR